MDFLNKNILVLTDGSEGMISQVIGLAQELEGNVKSIKTRLIFPWSNLQPGILPIFSWIFKNKIKNIAKPDIIISCGRQSVYLSIFLKRKYKNIINIHIQNPKVNFLKFNYIIAPIHDKVEGENVINSIGALHKFNENFFKEINEKNFDIPKKDLISVIIGGKNNHYKFSLKEANKLIAIIKNIKKLNPNYNFLIIFSRRTSLDIKLAFINNLNKIAIIYDENKTNCYGYALKYSNFFFVTSDSTSMISECAFTKKPIYVFHLLFKRKSKRFIRFHNQFHKLNITKKLEMESDLITWDYQQLNESKRIASILKKRIIKEN
ncbi:mitochondrial fission ELM1 family protein [Alphaproteobacteria bacterium]|nr:mitochondrial fission ELM1 family protein [Alphaproteobacteria bacterium]